MGMLRGCIWQTSPPDCEVLGGGAQVLLLQALLLRKHFPPGSFLSKVHVTPATLTRREHEWLTAVTIQQRRCKCLFLREFEIKAL